MRFLLTLAAALLVCVSCSSGNGGGGGAHTCFPVQPVFGAVQLPSAAAQATFADELGVESHARWPGEADLPSRAQVVVLSVADRQLFNYRQFFPDVVDLIIVPGRPELSLTTFPGAEHEHDAGADMVAAWFQLTPDHYEFDSASGHTTYFFRSAGPALSSHTRLWIADWVLAQLPTCFLYGGTWHYHEQGGGGAI